TAAESCTGTPPSAGVPNGSTSVPNRIATCPPSTPCRTSVCDPNLMANSGPCATNDDCPGGGTCSGGVCSNHGVKGICTTTPVTCGSAQGLPCTQVGPGTCLNTGCEQAGCDDT